MNTAQDSDDIRDKLRNLLTRLDTDEMFRQRVHSQKLYEYLDSLSEEQQAKVMEYTTYLLPPHERVDNGDGTYTYTWDMSKY